MSILNGKFTSNTTSAVIKLSELYGQDGIHTLYGTGTWDSGTLKVQTSPDGTNWFDLTGASLSANGNLNFTIRGLQLRLDFAGGLGSESVDYWIW